MKPYSRNAVPKTVGAVLGDLLFPEPAKPSAETQTPTSSPKRYSRKEKIVPIEFRVFLAPWIDIDCKIFSATLGFPYTVLNAT